MRKVLYFLLAGFCLTTFNAKATDATSLFNDAASFQITKAFKLGDGGSGVGKTGMNVNTSSFDPGCTGANCETLRECKTNTDCAFNEFCTSANICKKLCLTGVIHTGQKCSTIPTTPNCEIATTGHLAYCACTATSCGIAKRCDTSGTQKKCVNCAAGEACGCPAGTKSNGFGECVKCNFNSDCGSVQICDAAGKATALCKDLSCPIGQYAKNHVCVGCSTAIPNCTKCNNTPQCQQCASGYKLSGNSCVIDDKDADCKANCGSDYKFDKMGWKTTSDGRQEVVCTSSYLLSCGFNCTTGWDIDYLRNGTPYTCQSPLQCGATAKYNFVSSSSSGAASHPMCDPKQTGCKTNCGSEYSFDKMGAKSINGQQEIVCTASYPKSCGYACTTGWALIYLKNGTPYTCQKPLQCNASAPAGFTQISATANAGTNPGSHPGCK